MYSNILCGASKSHKHQRNLKMNLKPLEPMSSLAYQYSIPYDMDPDDTKFPSVVSLKPNKMSNSFHRNNCGGSDGIKIRKINSMANNFSDLIYRITPSCLFHPKEEKDTQEYNEELGDSYTTKREIEMVNLMYKVFESVLYMRKAYVSLQEAHSPWDAYKIKLSDVAVVAELRKLAILTERFRLSVPVTLRDVVTPYETALEKVYPKVKSKSNRRVSCSSQFQNQSMPELFEACMNSVKECSKTFGLVLLSLMKSVHWDITATVNSITSVTTNPSPIGPNHALESYVNSKIFQGFDHESFYLDGSDGTLTSEEFRSECFTQFSDMKSIDTNELLDTMPRCQFGIFCIKKYLSIVHPKMEESLFGDLEQRREVLGGKHPRSRFYRESFVGVAKAVWMLHLVAFSMDPLPSHFEGSMGVEFHPEYMESVARVHGRRVGRYVVGFPVSPGFKLRNGYVIKARVYLVPKE